jgi:hypothetical protein
MSALSKAKNEEGQKTTGGEENDCRAGILAHSILIKNMRPGSNAETRPADK